MRETGFTFVFVMVLVAAIGLALTAYAQATSHASQRQREAQLLWVGEQFRQAIGLYYERTPGLSRQYPAKLEDLLRDTRFLTVQRYLRTIYRDPMTGRPEWGLVPAPGGGIMGVYSLSNARPIKTGRFRIRESSFANATSLSDWKFTYEPLSMRIPSPETGSHAGR